MTRFYTAEQYRDLIGDYTAYVWRSYRKLKKHIPAEAKNILSIGSGLGDVERLLPQNITCFDPYSPIAEFRKPPQGWFDYSFAWGSVISCALPKERKAIIDLALRHSPAFLVHTGLKDADCSDDLFVCEPWSEAELFADYQWQRVGKLLVEVTNGV